jgi:site-specific recombinase XerD
MIENGYSLDCSRIPKMERRERLSWRIKGGLTKRLLYILLSRRPLVRTDAADMLKRRLKKAGLPAHYSPHSFRATGITNFLENDGTLEAAQRIAGHADRRTTKLYDRRGQKVLLEDMKRIRY